MNTPTNAIAVLMLDDDTLVTVRPIRESDGPLVRTLYESLSDATRYARFMYPRGPLSDADVRYFTRLDGNWHVGFLATVQTPAGSELPIGVARFVRFAEDPSIAEPAVVVADAWHHRGVGGALLLRLLATARSRGVATFRAHVLANNHRIRRLVRRWHGFLRADLDGPEVTYLLAVGDRAGVERATDRPRSAA